MSRKNKKKAQEAADAVPKPSKTMAHLALPETLEYTEIIKDLSALLKDHVENPWDASSHAERKMLVLRTNNIFSRLCSFQTKLFRQFAALAMARDDIKGEIKQTVATPQTLGPRQEQLAIVESKLELVDLIMRDFHARVANFMQKANLKDAMRKWQPRFEMALEIPPTRNAPGVSNNEKRSIIENHLEDLRERFPIVSEHNETMADDVAANKRNVHQDGSKQQMVTPTGVAQTIRNTGIKNYEGPEEADQDFEASTEPLPPLPFTLQPGKTQSLSDSQVLDSQPTQVSSIPHVTIQQQASKSLKAAVKPIAISKRAACESLLSKKVHIKFGAGGELKTAGQSVGLRGDKIAVEEQVGKKRQWPMERENELLSLEKQLDDYHAGQQKNISVTMIDSEHAPVNSQHSNTREDANVSGNKSESWLGDGLLAMLEEEAKLL